MKNLPVPQKKLYLKILIEKVELLTKRMRWKALLFEIKFESTIKFVFKTRKWPPQHKGLMEFEDDLQEMFSNAQFRRVNNDFKNGIKNDI